MSDNSENKPSNMADDEAFTGYDLETGVLQRVRRWRDAIPALVLIDALRVAGSPLYVGVFWVLIAIGGLLPVAWAIERPVGMLPRLTIQWHATASWLPVAWSLVLFFAATLPAALVARAGACYAAGRLQTFTQNSRVTLDRCVRLLLIPIAPLAITGGLSILMVIAGSFGRIGGIGDWAAELTAITALPIAILIGLIAGGALAAVPLAIAAAVVEKQSDLLDSLSRGYEYLFRRPVYLAFYTVCSAILVLILWQLAIVVAGMAILIGGWGLQIGTGESSPPQWFQWLLMRLPAAVIATAAWGQIGAIYLLMRQATNEQEVEDIAISPADTKPADLPTLKPEI